MASPLSFFTDLKRFGVDGFLLALLAMIGLAYLFPEPGVAEKPVSLGDVANYGVSVIFLFYGMRLSLAKLREGLANWRMHLLVQTTTFVVFPLLILAIKPLFDDAHESLWLSIFYLAALPSTVSSSVVMVSIAGGNIPAAIFNASISSLAGVFITPLWMSLFLDADRGAADAGDIVLKLSLQVLLPVLVGMLLNRRFGAFAERHKKRLRYFDQAAILLIVYTSFCHSFADHIFDGYGLWNVLWLALGMVLLFFTVFLSVYGMSRLLKFSPEDRSTVLFCGSKKSLVHGTVMVRVLFPDASDTGILLLPLMMYHALQLIFSGLIAQRIARRKGAVTSGE